MLYTFGSITLDTDRKELRRNDSIESVEPQVFDLLVLLLENRDRVVSKDEIFEIIWEGRFVSDVTLSSRINALRRALGDDGKRQDIIKTVQRRGFRFLADVETGSTGIKATKHFGGRRPMFVVAAGGAVALLFALGWLWMVDWDPFKRGSDMSSAPDKPTIAVVPFENRSGDPGQDYFADGLSEDILTELSRFGFFHVISRNSTFTYRGPDIEPAQVGQDLNARYILEGSVHRSKDGLRVTARLTDIESLQQIWAERYDVPFDQVFEVRDDIALSIVTTVAPEFLTAEMRRTGRLEPRNLDAWDQFIRGYWHMLRFTRTDNKTAQRLLTRAIETDPQQANYYGLLAVTHLMDGLYGWSENRDRSLELSLQNAEQGLALDEHDSLVLRSIGLVHFFSKRHSVALQYFRRAVAANPGDAENLALLGASLGVNGDYEGSRTKFEEAMALSPRDEHIATWYNYLAIAAFVDGQYEIAADWSRKTILANPQFPGGYRSLAANAGLLGNLEEARSARERLESLIPGISLAQLEESLPYFIEDDTLQRYLDGLRASGIAD